MNEQKVRGMLGLAVRARQVCFGEDACRKLVSRGRCGLVLLDGDTSENTRRKYESLCEREGIEIRILPSGLMAEATGRDNIAAALNKGSFAEQMKVCL